jgi:hypothetical protein
VTPAAFPLFFFIGTGLVHVIKLKWAFVQLNMKNANFKSSGPKKIAKLTSYKWAWLKIGP